jgi:hypothetical protein
MGLGTGIFLGCLFLGFIYLYINTRDRWNWLKIIKGVAILTFALITTIYLINVATNYFDKKESAPAAKISSPFTSLEGVNLGEKATDVQFRIPSSIDKTQKVQDEITYVFDSSPNNRYVVDKGTKKVIAIQSTCDEKAKNNPMLYSFTVNGIRCGSTGSSVLFAFNELASMPVRISCLYAQESEDSLVPSLRAYDISQVGLRFVLSNDSVISAIVSYPESIESKQGKYWRPCP